jgi:RNA polymerase-binding transcription factor DksA
VHYRYLTIEQRESLERLIRAQPGMTATLPRLHAPDYGVCQSCGKDIPYTRLIEFPAVIYCAACQPKT